MHVLTERGVSEEEGRGLLFLEALRGGEADQAPIGRGDTPALAQASAEGYVEFLGSLFSYYRNVRGAEGSTEERLLPLLACSEKYAARRQGAGLSGSYWRMPPNTQKQAAANSRKLGA